MSNKTETITLALDVLALHMSDGPNCELVKQASVRLLELEGACNLLSTHLASVEAENKRLKELLANY